MEEKLSEEIREDFLEEGSVLQIYTESPPHTRPTMANINKDSLFLSMWNVHSREGDGQESNSTL